MLGKLSTKVLGGLLILTFIFVNLGLITFANSSKEFDLKTKFTGKKYYKVINTIDKKDGYKLVIKSSKDLNTLKNEYSKLDKDISIKDIGNGFFKLKISKKSALSSDFSNLSSGKLPETIGGEQVVEPEVFEKDEYLSGEDTSLWHLNQVGAGTFQERLSTKDKIKVGILDSGIDSTQNDLNNNYDNLLSYDFINNTNNQIDDNGHGTQAAGVLGAEVNGTGIYGVDSNSDLVSLKVLDADGLGASYDVIEALNYAITNNIKVINLSFGGIGDPQTSAVCQAITEAKNAGVFVVVSAGNTNSDVSSIVPAGCNSAITVGSFDKNGNKSSFSNYGTGIFVYAPGEDIYTTNLNNTYIIKNGTSFSSPIVTGLISKEITFNPSLSYDEVLNNVKNNYNLVSSFSYLNSSGNTDNTSTGSISSGTTQVNQINFSKTKYYEGYFKHDGKIYGNSLYDNSYNFTSDELKGIKIYTYDEYQQLLKNQKKDFSIMSVPTNGLVGEWDLNGNTSDTSGYNNNGIPYNITWVDSGKGDGKLVASLNGTNSYISFPNNQALGLVGSSITVSTWYKLNSGDPNPGGGIGKGGYQYGGWEFLFGSANNAVLYVGGAQLYATHNLGYGVWVHAVGTFDTVTKKRTIYINGNKFVSDTYNTSISSTSYIGGMGYRFSSDYWKRYINGYIGQTLIYNRALSDSEVQQIYNDGLGLNNTTYSNTPTYTYNPVFSNPAFQYNYVDLGSIQSNTNIVLKSTSTTKKVDEGTKGDPVNLANGEFGYENTFMSIPGQRLPYEFKLSYSNQTYYNGPVGINWDHNYNKYLTTESGGSMLYNNGKNGLFRFISTGSTFEYNLGLKANLMLSGGLYQINYDSGDKEYFNSDKKLLKLEDKLGNDLNFTYSGGLISQVTDTLGRNINYTYDNNRLITVTDFNGRKVELTYFTGSTSSGSLYDLKEVTVNNGTGATKTIKFEYTTGGDNTTDHNMTKLVDSKGQTYVTNTYDANDRVATQVYGTGTITYNYTLSGSQVTQNSVTDKVGNVIDYNYDSNQNNTSTTYHTGSGNLTYTYTYNSAGYMTSETRPNGNGTKYTYDSKGNLTEKRQKADMSQADDNNSDLITTFTYNSANQVLTSSLPNGTTISNTYTNGNLTEITTSNLQTSTGATYSATKSFTYDSIGEPISSTDARGNTTTYTYSGGLLTQAVVGTGTSARTTSFTYNNYGILTSKTDARGNTLNYEITNFNQTGTGITAEGVIAAYIYDANNNKISENAYFTGGTMSSNYTYDVLDNVTQIVSDYDSGKQVVTNIKYDNNGNITEKQTGSGAKIKYIYNIFAKVSEERIVVDPNDNTKDIVTSYTYDNNGNLLTKIDPNGNITTYTYDLYDRVTKETKDDGNYTKLYYNKDNTITKQEKYSSGNTLLSKLEYTYNGLGKVLKEISYKDPSNSTGAVTKTYDYDKNGNLISKTDANGNTTTYTYDEFNNLTSTTDSLGNEVVNTYDKNNNLIEKQVVQNNGKTTNTSYTYDKDNRLTIETDNLNKTKTHTYNNLNQVTSITDENGNTINYTYNYNGKVKTKSEANSGATITTTYTYDERGNNTSIVDQNNNTTTYIYNNLNQLITTKYADNKEVNYTYDKAGNLLTQTDPNGTITTNTYDNLNRLTSRTIQTGTGVIGVTNETYSYDELGRLIEANDSNNHKLDFSYDNLNRLTQENQSGSIVGYTYDDNNNLLTVTNSNGNTTSYTYDELNRVLGISFSGSTVATYTYTGVLNDNITYGNNTNITQTFDNLNRLSSLNNGVKNYTYTYDDVSNITSDSYKNYTYDQIYRLTHVSNTSSGITLENYSYDNAGNRTNDLNNSYTSNNLNQYTYLSGSTLSGSLVYDNNGNIIDNGTYTFEYDYKNRLVKVSNLSGIIAEFKYDVLGRRYEKTTSTKTINYVYSNENVLAEYTTINGQTTKKEYINGLGTDNLLAYSAEEPNLTPAEREELSFCNENVLIKSSLFIKYGWQLLVDRCNNLASSGSVIVENTYYYAKNNLGSIDGITDNSGSLVTSYDYDSFGNFTMSGYDIGNDRLYTGREYDSEIGLYYLRARYYDSNLGRFISRDPIGQVDDVNLYAYVGNNPVGFVDRMGTDKNMITENLIVSIFDLAMENTGDFNLYQIYYGTKNSGPYDIKRNAFIQAQANNNGGLINFNGVNVESSNLGNLLFGMNEANNYIPSILARKILMDFEVTNAKIEGYGKYTKEIAKWDEHSDTIWYDKGEEIYSKYINAISIDEKINIITNAIIETNPEYNIRNKKEKEMREYYRNLLNNY